MVQYMSTPTHLFNVTVTQSRMTMVKDAGGGSVKKPEVIGTFAARIQHPAASDDELHPVGPRSFYQAMMFCDPGEDIREDDRLNDGTYDWDVEGSDYSGNENIFKVVKIKRSI